MMRIRIVPLATRKTKLKLNIKNPKKKEFYREIAKRSPNICKILEDD